MNYWQGLLLNWIDKYVAQIVKYPKMFGAPETVEMNLLLLLEFEVVIMSFSKLKKIEDYYLIDEYREWLKKEFPKLGPLYLSSKYDQEFIVKNFVKFREEKLERIKNEFGMG